jgi:hypothetical protein
MLASTHLTRGNRPLSRRSEQKKNKSLRRVKTLSTGARVEEGPSWLKKLIIWRQGITRLKEKKISQQVWTTETWPKVSTFLWLLARKKVLNWNKLQRTVYLLHVQSRGSVSRTLI